MKVESLTYILNIETATTVCSVSVSENDQVLALKELDNGYTHAENLHVFIQEVLNAAGISATQLHAVAISKGPGSYTGLRIGTSAAKGLCYALNIPLISVNTLQILSAAAYAKNKEAVYYCPMIDARRMEVYTAIYDQKLNTIKNTEALILDESSVLNFHNYPSICFFGNGMPKSKELLSGIAGVTFVDNVSTSAAYMPALAHNQFLNSEFEDVAYFEPFYLKDFFILNKTK